MKTIYAVTFVCLSLPALADVLDIAPIHAVEDNTAAASVPAPQPIEHHSLGTVIEFSVDDDTVGHVLDITSIHAVEDHTSNGSVPTPQPTEDHSGGTVADCAINESNGGSFTIPASTPMDGTELESTLRDDAVATWTILPMLPYSMDLVIAQDDGMSGVASSAMPKIADQPPNLVIDVSVDD